MNIRLCDWCKRRMGKGEDCYVIWPKKAGSPFHAESVEREMCASCYAILEKALPIKEG